MIYRLLADVVVVVHVSYVAFVILGLAAIWVGWARGWSWIRNRAFRLIHLAMITVVVLQAWAALVCQLTTLENYLRKRGGQKPYPLDFIEYWTHHLLFFDFKRWVFVLAYMVFGLAVVASFWLVPIQRKRDSSGSRSDTPRAEPQV